MVYTPLYHQPKNGDDWGMVRLWHCFTPNYGDLTIKQCDQKLVDTGVLTGAQNWSFLVLRSGKLTVCY